MKHFNQMTEQQMEKSNGGIIDLFILSMVGIITAASIGTIAGTTAGVAATNPKNTK